MKVPAATGVSELTGAKMRGEPSRHYCVSAQRCLGTKRRRDDTGTYTHTRVVVVEMLIPFEFGRQRVWARMHPTAIHCLVSAIMAQDTTRVLVCVLIVPPALPYAPGCLWGSARRSGAPFSRLRDLEVM